MTDEQRIRADERRRTLRDLRARVKRWQATFAQWYPQDLDRIIRDMEHNGST